MVNDLLSDTIWHHVLSKGVYVVTERFRVEPDWFNKIGELSKLRPECIQMKIHGVSYWREKVLYRDYTTTYICSYKNAAALKYHSSVRMNRTWNKYPPSFNSRCSPSTTTLFQVLCTIPYMFRKLWFIIRGFLRFLLRISSYFLVKQMIILIYNYIRMPFEVRKSVTCLDLKTSHQQAV